jgi:hypothetical protein
LLWKQSCSSFANTDPAADMIATTVNSRRRINFSTQHWSRHVRKRISAFPRPQSPSNRAHQFIGLCQFWKAEIMNNAMCRATPIGTSSGGTTAHSGRTSLTMVRQALADSHSA